MQRRVAILGAGPIGLDAALAFADAGFTVRVHEAVAVGAAVRRWGHVRLFTPWSMAVSPRMGRHLSDAGLAVPDGDVPPTGHELVDRLLVPVAGVPALAGVVRTGVRVLGVARRGLLKHEAVGSAARGEPPFRLLLDDGQHEWTEEADVVVDATGTYDHPNALGDGGVPAPGERAVAGRITRHLPDPATLDRWADRSAECHVLLVGAGKSAQTAARDLAERAPATTVTWLVRDADPDWGAIPGDTLPERQALVDLAERLRAGAVPGVTVRTGSHVTALRPDGDRVVATTERGDELVVDHLLALTGYVADTEVYRQLQVHECYATGAPMNLAAALLAAAGDGPADCLAQPAQGVDVLRSPEPDFFVLGAKSYGRNSAFLLRIGYEQVDEVAGAYVAPLIRS